jgi:hypothetical protein
MAKRVMKDGIELIKTLTGEGRGGSRPKPPKAAVRSASLEAPRALADHKKAKRRLTTKTVACVSFVVAQPARARRTASSAVVTGQPASGEAFA